MTHVNGPRGILLSKSPTRVCEEEGRGPEAAGTSQDDHRGNMEKKDKEPQRTTPEQILQDRQARLKRFREFQRKVLMEESGTEEGEEASLRIQKLLTRM